MHTFANFFSAVVSSSSSYQTLTIILSVALRAVLVAYNTYTMCMDIFRKVLDQQQQGNGDDTITVTTRRTSEARRCLSL